MIRACAAAAARDEALLAGLLRDPSPRVRATASYSLAACPVPVDASTRASAALLAVRDPHPGVMRTAQATLTRDPKPPCTWQMLDADEPRARAPSEVLGWIDVRWPEHVLRRPALLEQKPLPPERLRAHQALQVRAAIPRLRQGREGLGFVRAADPWPAVGAERRGPQQFAHGAAGRTVPAHAISEGTSTTMLNPGAEMTSQGGGDLFAAMNELAGEVTTLSRERIRPLVASLQENVDRIGGELADATPQLVADAKSLLARLNQASAAMNEVLSPQNRAHVATTLEDLAATADNARELSAELRQTQQKLDALMVEANAVVSENRPALKDAIADLAQITGSLAQRIDGIAQNLDSASRNVNEFTREIRKNPNRLLFTPPADKVQVEEE